MLARLLDRARAAAGLRRRARREIYYGRGPRLMSELRKRWILFTHPHADIRFEGPVHIAPGFSLYMPHRGTLIVGPGAEFRRGFRAEIVGNGRVVIGAGCIFSYSTLIQCTSSIEIADRSAFAQSVSIFDGNHSFRDPSKGFLDQGFELRPIRIGRNCAVFAKATIMADLGDHAIVGAHAVVNKPVPPYTVVGGVSAREISRFAPDEPAPQAIDGADGPPATRS
jgi:acetyltransferase-like isoleucine patch superfamily enzyme